MGFADLNPEHEQAARVVGVGVPEIRRLKQLEDANSKLKRLVADLTLDRLMLQDVDLLRFSRERFGV